jgi:preprotein translocase subunit Sec61beta
MSMLGHHRPALSRAGLVEFYESMAAGKETFDTLVKIATATAKHYGKPA